MIGQQTNWYTILLLAINHIHIDWDIPAWDTVHCHAVSDMLICPAFRRTLDTLAAIFKFRICTNKFRISAGVGSDMTLLPLSDLHPNDIPIKLPVSHDRQVFFL